MNPGEIREQLLIEHDRLRAMMALVTITADRVSWGERSRALHGALGQLAKALRAHNEREEHLARELELTCDVNRFVDLLAEEHAAEHRELYEALLVATTTSDPRVASAMAYAVCDRISAHMRHEEEELLADALLFGRKPAAGPLV